MNQNNFKNANQQSLRWNMQNQGTNNGSNQNQMQAMLFKQFYLQQNQQNNLGSNSNSQNNLINKIQNNNINNNNLNSINNQIPSGTNLNPNNINLTNNFQQMLLNNQQSQQQMLLNNQQTQKLNPQQSSQMQIQNMQNYNLLNNTNLATAQKDQFTKLGSVNNLNIPNSALINNNNNSNNNNFLKIQNIPNTNINTNFPNNLTQFPNNLLNNLALMSGNNPNGPNYSALQSGLLSNAGLNPSNFPSTQSLNTNNANQNDSQNQNMDMLKLIQDAISNLKSKTNNDEINQEKNALGTNNGESDISYGAMSLKNEYESQYSLEDENLKQLWSGFLTKNKKDKVCVDAYQIRHECSHFFTSEFNLNVSHRTQFEEIMKRPIIGVIAFSPQNETQCENFLEYINYFKEKDRAGVVNFKSQATMYIVPPGDFSRKFYQNPKKHLLGIFVDSSVDVEKYVDMNQLKLPPPVISSAEKKLLLKQQKNKQINSTQQQQAINNNIGNNNMSNVNSIIPNYANTFEALGFGNINNSSNLIKQNNDYDELIKNMSNEEKGKKMIYFAF